MYDVRSTFSFRCCVVLCFKVICQCSCVVAQLTFYANKNNVFLSIEGSWGSPY